MDIKVKELKESILEDNDRDADALREEIRRQQFLAVNVMSSPGSGKTTLLSRTVRELKNRYRIGVMEADIDSDVDARTMEEAGAFAVQLHTGGMCHLDAQMTRQGLELLGLETSKTGEGSLRLADASSPFDLVFLENVGNLVCPAEFDTGMQKNAVLFSLPEGDDKPLKYPLMFEKADVVVITKMDAAPAFDFDMEKAEKNIRKRNAQCPVIPLSAKTGEGFAEWISWLEGEAEKSRKWKK